MSSMTSSRRVLGDVAKRAAAAQAAKAPAAQAAKAPATPVASATAAAAKAPAKATTTALTCDTSRGMLPANVTAIVSFLLAHGYTHNAAAGIAGNIYRESMGDPESVGTGGGGLIGWTPLPSGFVTGNAAADLQTQLAAILTYNQGWAQYIPALDAAASPTAAADIYVTDFERAGIPAAGEREASAESVAAACGLLSRGVRHQRRIRLRRQGPSASLRGPARLAGLPSQAARGGTLVPRVPPRLARHAKLRSLALAPPRGATRRRDKSPPPPGLPPIRNATVLRAPSHPEQVWRAERAAGGSGGRPPGQHLRGRRLVRRSQ